jgi:HEPN domain-containing protein
MLTPGNINTHKPEKWVHATTIADKYGYWLMLSDYDIGTIDCLIKGERWVYVAYLCQQTIERLLKGMFVYYNNSEAPKTHNVSYLFNKIINSAKFNVEADLACLEENRAACEDFLIDIMFYYMSDYPFSYKNMSNRFVNREVALSLYEKTKYYSAWLKSFQPPIDIPDIPGQI